LRTVILYLILITLALLFRHFLKLIIPAGFALENQKKRKEKSNKMLTIILKRPRSNKRLINKEKMQLEAKILMKN